jgi:hypothetical protein
MLGVLTHQTAGYRSNSVGVVTLLGFAFPTSAVAERDLSLRTLLAFSATALSWAAPLNTPHRRLIDYDDVAAITFTNSYAFFSLCGLSPQGAAVA